MKIGYSAEDEDDKKKGSGEDDQEDDLENVGNVKDSKDD